MRLWVADGEKGLMQLREEGWRRLAGPCRLLCPWGGGMLCAGDGECCCLDGAGRTRYALPAPTGVCGLAAGGETAYLLSSDTDSLLAWSLRTGEMLYAAPAGVCPRGLALSPDGRHLAAAGGAAGEVLLFNERLEKQRAVRVPGVAVGVCFLDKSLAVLCAVGENELKSALLRISPLGVVSELFSCPEGPCCLCRWGDGCAAGCHGAVYALSGRGKVRRTIPCGYPAAVRSCGGFLLAADPWQGRVLLDGGRCLYAGPSPEDAWLDGSF